MTEQMRFPVVAIDGPAGAGKSTVARALASRLGYFLLDTGAIYRCVALMAQRQSIDWQDGPGLADLSRSLPLRFGRGVEEGRVFLGEKDVSLEIRTPEISAGASQVSVHPEVRAALLDVQRQLARTGPCVVEGRDVGTVVLPRAPVKLFLTASAEIRAQRRFEELAARGVAATREETLRDQIERDARDQNRSIAPLRQAEDALRVDTSGLELGEVIDKVEALCRDVLSRWSACTDGVSSDALGAAPGGASASSSDGGPACDDAGARSHADRSEAEVKAAADAGASPR